MDKGPRVRRDLDFFPVQHGGQQLVLVSDHLGLVQEGKAVPLPLFQLMTLLDGSLSERDLQMALIRERGGVLVEIGEVENLLGHLDASFLLDSERYRAGRDQVISQFVSSKVRPSSHAGRAYPDNPAELKEKLDRILAGQPPPEGPEGKIIALIAPHIDFSAGYRTYAMAYRTIEAVEPPSRIVLLGVGHKMMERLFCLTEKDFETPLGVSENRSDLVQRLREAGGDTVAPDDFSHRSEHSIEFQILFLQHLFPNASYTVIPILCGSLQAGLPAYTRQAYRAKAGLFLEALKQIVSDPREPTLIVAGIDLSHIGLKFGHRLPASRLKSRASSHDRKLLEHLSNMDADQLWDESAGVRDEYNVCGFAAMACLMEVLPPSSRGKILDYDVWDEEATRSAVSFAAGVFMSEPG
jgi:AmmeMemoRadiSam system protein B